MTKATITLDPADVAALKKATGKAKASEALAVMVNRLTKADGHNTAKAVKPAKAAAKSTSATKAPAKKPAKKAATKTAKKWTAAQRKQFAANMAAARAAKAAR